MSRHGRGDDADLSEAEHIALAYLEALYATAEDGYLSLWTAEDKSTRWFAVADLPAAAAAAVRLAISGRNVYHGIGLHPAPLGPFRRGSADGVVAIPGAWLDLDIAGPAHAEAALPPTEADALALLDAFPLLPSLVVGSGHGLHAHWLFNSIWALTDADARDRAAALVRRLQAAIRSLARRQQWALDPTADLARLLRLPGTVNQKPGLPPVTVTALHDSGTRYGIDALEAVLADDSPGTDGGPAGNDAPDEADRADFGTVLDGCAFLRHCRDDAGTLPEPQWHALMSIVALCRNGERLAHDLSAPYPRYDPRETQGKFEAARQGDKPLRCATIRNERDGAAYCDACPHWLDIASPIVLGYPQARATRGSRQSGPSLGLSCRAGSDGAEAAADEPICVRAVLPDAPVPSDAVVPRGWRLGPTGVERILPRLRGELRVVPIAPAPLVVTARLKDVADGAESLRLAWRRDGRWQDQTVERTVAASARDATGLAGHGAPITSVTARDVVAYLAAFEAANLDCLPLARVSTKMGWLGRRGADGFLLGRRLFRTDGDEAAAVDLDATPPADWREDWVAFRGVDDGGTQLADGFREAGDFRSWVEAVAAVADRPRVILALYASLTPPLLEIMDAPNFGIDWCGSTSTGKTTALRVAASVWGNPDERAAATVLHTWDATRVWVERAAATLDALPVLLDDTKRAKQQRLVAQTIYDIVQGRGRGRGSPSGTRRAGHWRTVLLSTGEAPATSFTEDGGTRARILTLWRPPFGTADAATATLVGRLNAALRLHHGHAGPRFVRHLLERRNDWDDWRSEYRALHREHLDRAGDDPVAGRMAEYFAVLDLASLLAHEALRLPWPSHDPVATLHEELAAEGGEADRARAALAAAMSWAAGHQHAFFGRHQTDDHGMDRVPSQGWAGRWDNREDWATIAFLPHRLRTVLKEAGQEPESTLRLWRDRGWLEVAGDRRRHTKQVRLDGEKTWAVVVRRASAEEAGGWA